MSSIAVLQYDSRSVEFEVWAPCTHDVGATETARRVRYRQKKILRFCHREPLANGQVDWGKSLFPGQGAGRLLGMATSRVHHKPANRG